MKVTLILQGQPDYNSVQISCPHWRTNLQCDAGHLSTGQCLDQNCAVELIVLKVRHVCKGKHILSLCGGGICSVILAQLEPFRNYKGFGITFLKILDAIYSFAKMRIFLIPLRIGKFQFSFFHEKQHIFGGEMRKFLLQKILEISYENCT